jgi:hypothetical protein
MSKNRITKNNNSSRNIKKIFAFKARLWRYEGPSSWCFVTIPKNTAKRIRSLLQASEESWGRLKTTVNIGSSNWKTSIWYDRKAKSYLLPIKKSIRNKEDLTVGQILSGKLEFNFECDKLIPDL